MKRSVEYAWRLFATALAFAVFAVGTAALSTLVLPVVARCPGSHERRVLRSRRLVSGSLRLFIGFVRLLRLMSLRCEHPERLHDAASCVIVANHPTLIDIALLVSIVPEACCIAKPAVWQNPLLRGAVRAIDYVPRLEARRTIDECVRRIEGGDPLVIFPEGTRSPETGLRRFDRGAAAIVARARCPLVPVTIRCEPRALGKHDPWYRVARRRLDFELRIHSPIELHALFPGCASDGIFRRKSTAFLQNWFEENLAHDRPVAARA